MSQRNPMNERYQSEDHQGKTRKSAASAKPKSKAAASVVVQTSSKTPQQKKADAKAARRKAQDEQRALDRKYYNPDTKEYKRLRRLWWGLLGGAVVCTAGSFFLRESLGDAVSMGIIVAACALIIAAFYVDFSKIRKERRAYQDRMVALEEKQKKEERAAARAAAQASSKKGSGKNASRNPKTQQAAAEANAAEQAAKEQAKDEKPARRGLFGSGFRLANREKAKEEKAAAKAAKAADAAEADAK